MWRLRVLCGLVLLLIAGTVVGGLLLFLGDWESQRAVMLWAARWLGLLVLSCLWLAYCVAWSEFQFSARRLVHRCVGFFTRTVKVSE